MFSFSIALTFGKCLGSTVIESLAKFQSCVDIFTKFGGSRLYEILRYDVFSDAEMALVTSQWRNCGMLR